MSSSLRKRSAIACVLALVSTAALAACGSSSTTSATTASASSGGSARSGSSSAALKVKIKPVTIGVLPYVGAASEVLEQDADAVKAAAAELGWKVQFTDPNGSTTAMQSAMAAMIQNHDAAIITMAIDAPLLGGELAAAKAANIPVINVNNEVDPKTASAFTAQISPAETQWGAEWAKYMIKDLKPGPVLQLVAPPYNVYTGVDAAMKVAEAHGFTSAASEETNVANIQQSYQSATRGGLEAHPSTQYVFLPADFAPPIVEPTLKLVNKPDVTLITRYDDKATIALMRSGAKILDVTTNLYTPGLLAVDELAAYVDKGTPLHTILGGSQFPFTVITNKTIGSYPSSGYAYSLSATMKPFLARWQKEYGQ